MGIWDDDEQADKNSAASGDQQSPPRQGEQPEGKACDKGSEPLRLIASLLSTEGGRGPIHEEIDEFKRLLDEDFLAFASQEHEDLPDEAVAHNILDDIHMKLLTLAECPQLSRRTIVAVAGGFSSGKSSFLNAFLGLDGSLPVDTRPTTVIPTFVTKGDRSRISVLNKFGCDVELNKDGFRAISHQFKEDYGIGFTMILQHAILTLDEFAYNNLAFIDTPGYTKAEGKKVAGDNTDEQSARRQVAEADALLWFMDVENGTVQEEDVRFLKSVLEEVRQQRDGHEMPVYFIFNKADKKTPSAVDDVCRKGIEILVEKGIAFAGLSAYSKRMGELFKSGEGIAAFLESIDKPSDDRPKLERELRGVFDKYREHHKAKLASERLNLAVLNKLAIIQEDSQDEEELRGLASDTGDSLDGLIDKKKKLIHTVQSLIIPGIVDIEAKFNKQMDTILDAVYREEAIIDAPAPKASRKGKNAVIPMDGQEGTGEPSKKLPKKKTKKTGKIKPAVENTGKIKPAAMKRPRSPSRPAATKRRGRGQ
jgi:GTP-binding protein EngB required for normal cell division